MPLRKVTVGILPYHPRLLMRRRSGSSPRSETFRLPSSFGIVRPTGPRWSFELRSSLSLPGPVPPPGTCRSEKSTPVSLPTVSLRRKRSLMASSLSMASLSVSSALHEKKLASDILSGISSDLNSFSAAADKADKAAALLKSAHSSSSRLVASAKTLQRHIGVRS